MNKYIAYLNSLHNLHPGGANALAESQALNSYFLDMYEPFPVAKLLAQRISQLEDQVFVLTGHAGDGKTTVALDIYRHFVPETANSALSAPMKECTEVVLESGRKLFIIKDMSELPADERKQWVLDAFSSPGSYLIISNTGPLLATFDSVRDELKLGSDLESQMLDIMDMPVSEDDLSQNTLAGLTKPLVLLNMARIDNVGAAVSVLGKMARHPAWADCDGCEEKKGCPLKANRDLIVDSAGIAEQRVSWIYQRQNAYGQRLTMHQMVAHFALSITAGQDCHHAKAIVADAQSTATGPVRGLDQVLFSDTFFGYRNGESWVEAATLQAIDVVQRQGFGGPVAPDYAREIDVIDERKIVTLPPLLADLRGALRTAAASASGVKARTTVRRMEYMFGRPNANIGTASSAFLTFVDTFLLSPRARQFEEWRLAGKVTLNNADMGRLKRAIFDVLLEFCSGFTTGQFGDNASKLYITLRRPDRNVVQPTQLVVASLDLDDFKVGYTPKRNQPCLNFKSGVARLDLPLPLLDYIHNRSEGNLGRGLAPIHLAQLEWFKSSLLDTLNRDDDDPRNISLLRADISGAAKLYHYCLDDTNVRLELL